MKRLIALLFLWPATLIAKPLDLDRMSLTECTTTAIKNSVELSQAQNRLQSIRIGNSRSMFDVLRPSLQVGPSISGDGKISTSINGGIDLLAPFGPARWQKKTNNLAIKDAEAGIESIKRQISRDVSDAWHIHKLNLNKLDSLKDMSKTLFQSLGSSKKESDLTKAVTIFLLRDADIRTMEAERDVLTSRATLLKVMQTNEE